MARVEGRRKTGKEGEGTEESGGGAEDRGRKERGDRGETKAKRREQNRSGNWRTNGKIVRRNEGTRRIELSCPYCAMLVSPITIAGGLYEKREARGVGE